MNAASRHVRSLWNATPVHDDALGTIRRLTADELPLLERLSIKRLLLAPGSIREPHWHANANELGYVLAGSVLITIVDNADAISTIQVTAGQMFHINSGALHAIENVGDGEAELIIVFSHERPQDFSLHAIHFLVFFDQPTPGDVGYRLAAPAFAPGVLAATFGVDAAALPAFPRVVEDPLIVKRRNPIDVA